MEKCEIDHSVSRDIFMDNFVDEIGMKACYRPFSLSFRVDPLHKIENEQY